MIFKNNNDLIWFKVRQTLLLDPDLIGNKLKLQNGFSRLEIQTTQYDNRQNLWWFFFLSHVYQLSDI